MPTLRPQLSHELVELNALRVDRVRGKMLNTLRRNGTKMKRLLEQTVTTWNHDVTFTVQSPTLSRTDSGRINIEVFTGDVIWNILEEGTDVRYVVVSPDWQSKSVPNWLGAEPGQGVVVAEGEQPGIEARNWNQLVIDEVIGELEEELFEDMLLVTR